MDFISLILFTVCVVSNYIDGYVIDSKYASVPGLDGLYKLYNTPKQYDDAKKICERDGANLFYPENAKDLNAILSFWQDEDQEFPVNRFFIGVVKTGNTFNTLDGIPISCIYNRWGDGEPNFQNSKENCVEIQLRDDDWVLNDELCTTSLPAICKKSTNSADKQCSLIPNLDSGTKISSVTDGNTTITGNRSISGAVGLYKLHNTPATFHDAKTICEREGARLFYPTNETELNAVMNLWKNADNASLLDELFLGIGKPAQAFITVDGTSLSGVYNKWATGQPDNECRRELCVSMKNQSETWLLSYTSCCRKLAFICKSPNTPSNKENTKCEVADFEFSEELGKCYKFHNTPLTWSEAQDKCRAENSHLAVINSNEEAGYIATLAKRLSHNTAENITRGLVLLGFQKDNQMELHTAEGKSPYNPGYIRGPPNEDDRRWCSAMHEGNLHKIECDDKTSFICEYGVERSIFGYKRPPYFTAVQQYFSCNNSCSFYNLITF